MTSPSAAPIPSTLVRSGLRAPHPILSTSTYAREHVRAWPCPPILSFQFPIFNASLPSLLRLSLLLPLLAAPPALQAATPYTPVHPDPVLESWRWRSFPELKGRGLTCMTEDIHGNMWFGVSDGAVRYDGLTWTDFTSEDGLVGGTVLSLCAARDGSVYAGTEEGISRFSEEKWERVFPPEEGHPGSPERVLEQALPWGAIRGLMQASDGDVWAGTVWGALRLRPEGPTLYTLEDIEDALRDRLGYLRFAIVPEDAVNPDGTTGTRTLCRNPASVDTDGNADWHIVPTRGASPGAPNTDEVHEAR